ncbi:MAG TPA: DUF4396 domain-containing protein [Mucilaginibacter sp.]
MTDLATISYISIAVAAAICLIIAIDICFNPQKMWVMNLVWPLTALYAGPLALILYFKIGRMAASKESAKPFWQSVLTGTLHCGSGCTLGDLIAANLLLYCPVILFGSHLYGEWVVEYVLAFLIGIAFQYEAIRPMRKLSRPKVLVAALKADTLSLTFWQLGMYGWMAICHFLIFDRGLSASGPVFWLMMQIGMLFGSLTAYPVNWWLIRKGIKEAM